MTARERAAALVADAANKAYLEELRADLRIAIDRGYRAAAISLRRDIREAVASYREG